MEQTVTHTITLVPHKGIPDLLVCKSVTDTPLLNHVTGNRNGYCYQDELAAIQTVALAHGWKIIVEEN